MTISKFFSDFKFNIAEHHKYIQGAYKWGFPGGTVVKNLPANAGDSGSIPESGGSPGGRNGNTLEFSCLENSMDRGAWQATVHEVTKSQTQLSTHTSTC